MPDGTDLGELARLIDDTFESDVVPALIEYTAIPCLSPAFDNEWREHGHLRAAAELVAAWCAGREVPGCTVEVVALDGRTPMVLAEIEASDPARVGTTLIYGHFDKQPALGDWAEGLAPFSAVRRGDRLYGRGTADDGYAAFAAFAALEALARSDRPHGRCVVLIEGSEESGSPDLDAYLGALSDRLGRPALVICLDSGAASYDRLWLTSSLRGLVGAELRVEVLREGVHSGAAGGAVPSSFRILRALLERIESAESGTMLLPELASSPPPGRRQEIARLVELLGKDGGGGFPTVPGLRLSGDSETERVELRTWGPSLEVTGIAGIPAMRDAGNVLRPFTEAKLSIRLPPDVDAGRAGDTLREALEADPPAGATVSCTVSERANGFAAPPLPAWLASCLERCSLELFGAPPGTMGEGGTIPFLATLLAGLPEAAFVVTGVLGPESNAHGPNEFLHLPTARGVSAAVAEILAAAP